MALTLIFLVIFLLGLILFAKKLIRKWTDHWPSQGVQYLHAQSIVQRLATMNFKFIQQDLDMYRKLKGLGKKYGGYMELWNPIWYVVDLDLLKNIFIKDFDHFADHRGFATAADPHLYLNLFNLRGEPWRDLRVKMTPAFTTGKMRRMFDIFDGCAQQLVGSLEAELNQKKFGDHTIEMRPHIQHVAMDLIANAAFGVKTDIFENPQNSTFMQMSNQLLSLFAKTKNTIKLLIITILPNLAKFLKLSILDSETDQFFSSMVRQVVRQRMEAAAAAAAAGSSDSENKKKSEDFMQIMLDAQAASGDDQTFSEDLLIAQCLVFILGGFDTVDALLSWAMYELAVCPEIQEKLYNDIKAAVDANGGKFSYDIVVNDLTYLDMVIQEALRKYPPPIRLDRIVTRPYKVPDSDLVLPKGTMIIIPTYAIQRDPDIYPEPDRFIPERFTKENSAERHPFAFTSFGAGPRSCIGNRFALAEAKFIVAHLILNFKLEPSQKTQIPPIYNSGGALKPMDGVPLKVTKRK